MSLSSISFMFGALPIFLFIYYVSKPKYRIYELLVFSIWFYYVNEPNPGRLIYVLGLITVNYVFSVLIGYYRMSKPAISKICLTAGVIIDVGILAYYKWFGYSVNVLNRIFNAGFPDYEIILLAGVSFFAFALISYLADVYNRKCEAAKNPVKFFTYVLMFPKILMGPIARYSDMKEDFVEHSLTTEDIGEGARRIMLGFCKKTIIADNLALLVSEVNRYGDIEHSTIVALWLGAIAYSLELFFDFSGYTDMAIGFARILGYHIKENFNYPYMCKSFTDFWRRWHISLSQWFRDYIYIPLGGSRCSRARNILNLLVVWTLTGMWHGTGMAFITWGLVYFTMLVVEKYIVKPDRLGKITSVLWRIITLCVINFNWVLFSHSSLSSGIKYCMGMIGVYWHNTFVNAGDIHYLREYGLYLVIALIFSTPIAGTIGDKLQSDDRTMKAVTIITPILYVLAFVWGLSFALLGFHNPFMYQQF